jgi:hypothetical protein
MCAFYQGCATLGVTATYAIKSTIVTAAESSTMCAWVGKDQTRESQGGKDVNLPAPISVITQVKKESRVLFLLSWYD